MNCPYCKLPLTPSRFHWEPGGCGTFAISGEDMKNTWNCENCLYKPHFHKSTFTMVTYVSDTPLGPIEETSITFTVPYKGRNYTAIVRSYDQPCSKNRFQIYDYYGNCVVSLLKAPNIKLTTLPKLISKFVYKVKCFLCKNECFVPRYDCIVFGPKGADETWVCNNHKTWVHQGFDVIRNSTPKRHKRTLKELFIYVNSKQIQIPITLSREKIENKIATYVNFS